MQDVQEKAYSLRRDVSPVVCTRSEHLLLSHINSDAVAIAPSIRLDATTWIALQQWCQSRPKVLSNPIFYGHLRLTPLSIYGDRQESFLSPN
jgi:hypothetical protein